MKPPRLRLPPPDIGPAALVTGREFLREAQRLQPGQLLVNELVGPKPYVYGPICRPRHSRRVGLAVACRHCNSQVLRYDYDSLGIAAYVCLDLACFVNHYVELSTRQWSELVRDVTVSGIAEVAGRTGPHGGGN